MRNHYLLATLPFLGGGLQACQAAPRQDVRPNIVIVIGDDCSYSDLGCYGSPVSITPRIDSFAKEGMLFTRCSQTAPMSSPTRHTLYTGLYPIRSGAYPNHTFVYDDVKSFVQYFGEAGYRTALYGKQHVWPQSVFSYDYLGEYKSAQGMDFEVLDRFMKEMADKPFFLVVASHESHSPWNCGDPSQWSPETVELPPFFVDTPETRQQYVNYLAEVNVLDSQLGAVNDLVKKNGLEENTLIIFLSEQGNSFTHAKWTCYNQGLHSGMIVKYPPMVKAGSRSDALVEYVDVLPTLMDIAGVKYSQEDLDGRSFVKVLKGRTDEHKKYTYGLQTSRGIHGGPEYYGIRSISDGRYRYVWNFTPEARFKCANLNSDWWRSWVEKAKTDEFARKQVDAYVSRPAEELYDIVSDPYEQENRIDDPALQEIRKELRAQLLQWMKSQGDKGQETEMNALDRMRDGGGSKAKLLGKSPAGNAKGAKAQKRKNNQ